MKKTKPKYTRPEITTLLESIAKIEHFDDPELRSSLESFLEHNPTEEVSKFLDESDNDEMKHLRAELSKIEAYEELASEAACLESQARAIRSTVKAFKCPLEDLPKMINDTNNSIAAIATWRLSLGR